MAATLPVTGRRAAARRIAGALGAVASVQLGVMLLLQFGPARLHDPEYGRRLEALRARVREHPGRPLVVVLGSSRAAMGVHPAALAPGRPHAPLLFNMSLVGSGPVMQLLAWRRLLADGVRPDAVVVEYWPAFLHEAGAYHEAARLDRHRLRPCDGATVAEFFPDPAETFRELRHARWSPVATQRRNWLNQLRPEWLPAAARHDSLWARIDGWGHLPGRDSVGAAEREGVRDSQAAYFLPLFRDYEVSPVADRALRQLLAECAANSTPAALLYLPEAPCFREWIPPEAQKRAAGHEARLRADGLVPFIDARDWVEAGQLPDRIHLTTPGAIAVTRRLSVRLDELWPDLPRRGCRP